MYYESQWANCSYGFNLHAGKQAERIKELEAGPTMVAIREMIEAECVKSNAEYFAQMEKQTEFEKLRNGLENCRLFAARNRKEDLALLILGFCAEAGVVWSVTR